MTHVSGPVVGWPRATSQSADVGRDCATDALDFSEMGYRQDCAQVAGHPIASVSKTVPLPGGVPDRAAFESLVGYAPPTTQHANYGATSGWIPPPYRSRIAGGFVAIGGRSGNRYGHKPQRELASGLRLPVLLSLKN